MFPSIQTITVLSYQSELLGIRMLFPDNWELHLGKPSAIEKFALHCQSGEDPGTLVSAAFARQRSPSDNSDDVSIEIQVCHKSFVKSIDPTRVEKHRIQGLETFQFGSVNVANPESIHLRWAHWQCAPSMHVYISLQAKGRARLDYAQSVLETLSPIELPQAQITSKPLYDCEPWCVPATLYKMTKHIPYGATGSLNDLQITSTHTDESWTEMRRVLRGKQSLDHWQPLELQRQRSVPVLDCYHGPKGLPYHLGLYSEAVIDAIRSNFELHFDAIPCRVEGAPYFILVAKAVESCLDISNSQLKRFDDGGIMRVERPRFISEKLSEPLVFCVPEIRSAIFATASIRERVQQAGCQGVAFHPVDGNGREFTCEH